MEELPLEIIESIVSYLEPYKDYSNVALVSKVFAKATQNLVERKRRSFENLLRKGQRKFWKYRHLAGEEVPPPCAYHRGALCGGRLYIVANNLFWYFDLVELKWTRLAFAPQDLFPDALFTFDQKLVMFLGPSWDQDGDYDQDDSGGRVVLLYDTVTNEFSSVAHRARAPFRFFTNPTVLGRQAVLVHYQPEHPESTGCPEIHCLDLESLSWTVESAVGRHQPQELDTLCQIKLSEYQLIYIGATWHGEEAWLLEMGVFFTWTRLTIFQEEFAPKKAEHLSKLERIGDLAVCLAPSNNPSSQTGHRTCVHAEDHKKMSSLHMLDLSKATDQKILTWLKPSAGCSVRGYLSGYCLVATPYEVLVFGGLREDSKGRKAESNSLFTTRLPTNNSV